MKPRSAEMLASRIAADPDLQAKIKEDPAGVIRRLAAEVSSENPRALENDRAIYRIVVSVLGFLALLIAGGIIYLHLYALKIGQAPEVPETLSTLAGMAIGALAGLLAPAPGNRQ